MLHAVAQLAQHSVGHVQRVLGDKVHAHAFRANQAHQQLNALNQHFGRFVKKQVRLVKEEHHLGFFDIADFGQLLKQL